MMEMMLMNILFPLNGYSCDEYTHEIHITFELLNIGY